MKKYEVIENSNGELILVIFGLDGNIEFVNGGYEFPKSMLQIMLQSLNRGEDTLSKWNGDTKNLQEYYDRLTLPENGCEVVADNDGVYAEKMRDSARFIFGCRVEEKVENVEGEEFWEVCVYDPNGDVIYYTDAYEYFEEYERDAKGNIVRFIDSYGACEEYRYDDNGNCIYKKCGEVWSKYEYDQNGNCIYKEKSDDGYYEKYQYDKDGNKIYSVDSIGRWYKYQYDKDGNMVFMINESKQWWKYGRGKSGNMVCKEHFSGYMLHEYDDDGREISEIFVGYV